MHRRLVRVPRRTVSLAVTLAACALALVLATAPRAAAATPSPGATLTGTLRDGAHAALPGMVVQALPAGAGACTPAAGCVSTTTDARGAFTLSGLAPGDDALEVVDGLRTLTVQSLEVPVQADPAPVALTLPAPAVPVGIRAHGDRRALAWLNAARRRAGVPAGVVLNPRWSRECAAHDAYELAGDTLGASENPTASGYSLGGAWAGQSGDLAEGRWTAAATPWQDAPVSQMALLAPSLSVTGIDDGPLRQCAVTFPGMLRPPPAHDTVHVVPAPGAHGVARSELARETPFTPVQFVGLPSSQTTGPELFVYLNRAGETGQAPVRILRASLLRGRRSVAVRSVDAATPTLGADLAGAIVIPLDPLAAETTYRASVTVADATRTLTRTWTFTTG